MKCSWKYIVLLVANIYLSKNCNNHILSIEELREDDEEHFSFVCNFYNSISITISWEDLSWHN